jgi:hypothetical protein
MSTQTINGRAFEWAVGHTISMLTTFPIVESPYSKLAKVAFDAVSPSSKIKFEKAAAVSLNHILNKEKNSINSLTNGKIKFNADMAGSDGDVRDVLVVMPNKVLGFSCKNNHEALKHSRLSATVDFIKKWKIDENGCSLTYWNTVKPIFAELKKIKIESNSTFLWDDIHEKADRFYWPILDAWATELTRICLISDEKQSLLCRGILSYLVGRHDFYKLICVNSSSVNVQAWNFNKTLATKQTKYPDIVNAINNKNGGQYSKTIVFNRGYSLNFRIHSASSRVEPSLKFDINAIGLPAGEVYQQTLDC